MSAEVLQKLVGTKPMGRGSDLKTVCFQLVLNFGIFSYPKNLCKIYKILDVVPPSFLFVRGNCFFYFGCSEQMLFLFCGKVVFLCCVSMCVFRKMNFVMGKCFCAAESVATCTK